MRRFAGLEDTILRSWNVNWTSEEVCSKFEDDLTRMHVEKFLVGVAEHFNHFVGPAKQKGAFAPFSLDYELVRIFLPFFSGGRKMSELFVGLSALVLALFLKVKNVIVVEET